MVQLLNFGKLFEDFDLFLLFLQFLLDQEQFVELGLRLVLSASVGQGRHDESSATSEFYTKSAFLQSTFASNASFSSHLPGTLLLRYLMRLNLELISKFSSIIISAWRAMNLEQDICQWYGV